MFVKIPPVQMVETEKEAKPLRQDQFSLLVRKAERWGGNNGQLEWKWNLGHERASPPLAKGHTGRLPPAWHYWAIYKKKP